MMGQNLANLYRGYNLVKWGQNILCNNLLLTAKWGKIIKNSYKSIFTKSRNVIEQTDGVFGVLGLCAQTCIAGSNRF